MIVNSILYPPHMGALNQLYLTTMPEAENMGGKVCTSPAALCRRLTARAVLCAVVP